ncbi:hypothetical protein [Aporhodopirellula aestuarii]|uniref:Uncharacterized protein n=1 Tax=Aporhodopirellula aestuarii TaxID=2950107 RepID=A0ABT0U9Q0_9BACT|nr:hypothetical protein [Aporhodopirellula aestuarii]MCM2373625.1 hypothetical protein [Aporhodopirellula aestuarii]
MRRLIQSVAKALFAQPSNRRSLDALSMKLHDVVRLGKQEQLVSNLSNN